MESNAQRIEELENWIADLKSAKKKHKRRGKTKLVKICTELINRHKELIQSIKNEDTYAPQIIKVKKVKLIRNGITRRN